MAASPFDYAQYTQTEEGCKTIEYSPFTYIPSLNDVLHTVLEGETLQHIAFKYYKDSGLWYVIADANKILNPFKEVTPGLLIVIPANI